MLYLLALRILVCLILSWFDVAMSNLLSGILFVLQPIHLSIVICGCAFFYLFHFRISFCLNVDSILLEIEVYDDMIMI